MMPRVVLILWLLKVFALTVSVLMVQRAACRREVNPEDKLGISGTLRTNSSE